MRNILASVATLAVLAATACGPSADIDAVDLVETYLADQVDATHDVLSGSGDPDTVDEINTEYWQADEWPDMSDLREWSWTRTQAGETVPVEGDELADVASDLEDASGYLVHAHREGDDIPAAEEAAQDAVDAALDYLSP